MKTVEVEARSVDEAIAEGLSQLNTTREEVEISVLEEGNKGLFGFMAKQARVRLAERPTIRYKTKRAEQFVTALFDKMDVPSDVSVSMDEEIVRIEVSGDNLGLLIGRRGQTLDALQYLVGLVVNREGGEWIRVMVDVEGYRKKREETLRALARRLAGKVAVTGRRVALDPMNALDRRTVHSELQMFDGVETHSEGKDPYRRVIIIPKR